MPDGCLVTVARSDPHVNRILVTYRVDGAVKAAARAGSLSFRVEPGRRTVECSAYEIRRGGAQRGGAVEYFGRSHPLSHEFRAGEACELVVFADALHEVDAGLRGRVLRLLHRLLGQPAPTAGRVGSYPVNIRVYVKT